MPLTIDALYREYERLLRAGELVLEGIGCTDEDCRASGGQMKLTGSTVPRGMVLLERDRHGELRMDMTQGRIAIARCVRGDRSARVLPADLLPRKTYGLAVIELLLMLYNRGDLDLRRVVECRLGDKVPAHTTLHGWTEGLGAHALGRPGGDAGGLPASRFVAEVTARKPEVAEVMRQEVIVDPRRYRSDGRRERLAAVAKILAVVLFVSAASHPNAMAVCRGLMLGWSRSSALEFRSRLINTAIEHRGRSTRSRSGSSTTTSRNRCPTRTRSPPGASPSSLR
jgi:hypothetical protein